MKRISIFTAFVLLSAIQVKAQEANRDEQDKKGLLQRSICQAVLPALSIVETEYVLTNQRDSTKKYGYGGKEYFGKGMSMGVNVDGYIYTIDDVYMPWLSDTLYTRKYKDVDSLAPMIDQTYVYSLMDSTCEKLYTDSILVNKGFLAKIWHPDSIALSGADTTGKIEGWIMLIYQDSLPSIENRLEHKSALYESTIKYNSFDHNWEIDKMAIHKNVVGGLFILPYIHAGNIELRVLGLIEKKLLSWRVVPLHTIK
jgi:hypothetical protein